MAVLADVDNDGDLDILVGNSGPGEFAKLWLNEPACPLVTADCDGDGEFFTSDRNVGEGATPVPGSGILGFDPTDPATFDPFQMDDKGVSCSEFAAQVTGNSDGFIEDLGHLESLEARGFVVQTEGPAGLRLDSPLQPPLIVNCPVPLTVK